MRLIKHLVLCLLLLEISIFAFARTISISEFENEIYLQSNNERRLRKVPDLAYDDGLADVARRHSKSMASSDYFAHKDREGLNVGGRMQKYYPAMFATSVGENLAFFEISDQVFSAVEIVTGWMNSPPHRKSLLNAEFTHIGVGVVIKGDKLYATQVFARPLYKILSPVPTKVAKDATLSLEFQYMGTQDPSSFQATLDVPDPKTEIQVSENRYRIGSEPQKLVWLDGSRFRIDLSFRYGHGKYMLRFGSEDSFYCDGITIRVK